MLRTMRLTRVFAVGLVAALTLAAAGCGGGDDGDGAGAGPAVAAVVAGCFAQPLMISPTRSSDITVACPARVTMMPPLASALRATVRVSILSRQTRRP